MRAVHSLFEVLHPHCFRLSIAPARLRAVILMFSDVAQRLVYKGTLCRIRSSPSHRVHFHSSTVTHKMRSFTTLAVLAAIASAPLLVLAGDYDATVFQGIGCRGEIDDQADGNVSPFAVVTKLLAH